MSRASCPKKRRAFTVVELLIVLGIIAGVICLLVPLVRKAREQQARAECLDNLRRIGVGMHRCNDVIGHLPPTMGWLNDPAKTKNNSYGSVFWSLLPFVDEGTLFQRGAVVDDVDPARVTFVPWKVWDTPVKTYVCPADSTWTSGRQGSYLSNYLVFGGGNANWPDGLARGPTRNIWGVDHNFYGGSNWGQYARIPATFQDGTSNTIAFSERFAQCGDSCQAIWSWWGTTGSDCHLPSFNTVPGSFGHNMKFITPSSPSQCLWQMPAALHGASGIAVCMGDASTHLISPAIGTWTWAAICTPACGEACGNWD
jgi:hypothetical protein